MMMCGLVLMLISLLGFIVSFGEIWDIMAGMFLAFIAVGVLFFKVENKLKNHFPE